MDGVREGDHKHGTSRLFGKALPDSRQRNGTQGWGIGVNLDAWVVHSTFDDGRLVRLGWGVHVNVDKDGDVSKRVAMYMGVVVLCVERQLAHGCVSTLLAKRRGRLTAAAAVPVTL